MIGWLTHLQHTPRETIWLVGLLDRNVDDFGRPYFALQVEGAKTGLELPGIVYEVITLAEIRSRDGDPFRAFVCTTINELSVPAKDRSGRLAIMEQAHLGRLMAKIRARLGAAPTSPPNFDLPAVADDQTHSITKAAQTMVSDMDLNGADTQGAVFDLIPANGLAKACLTISPDGAGPEVWPTQSETSTAPYLNPETILVGADRPTPDLHLDRFPRESGGRARPCRVRAPDGWRPATAAAGRAFRWLARPRQRLP